MDAKTMRDQEIRHLAQQLAPLLQLSLDPRQGRQAEASIKQAEQDPRFSLALLEIIGDEASPNTIRLSGALYFKNFVKHSWVDVEATTDEKLVHIIRDELVVAEIRARLIDLMVFVPPTIQTQIGAAISIIADSDFWFNWQNLVDDLARRLTPNNPTVNNGVLSVAHSIFKRWRPLFVSDDLFTEINHVLEKFCGPFLKHLEDTDALISSNENDKAALEQYFATLTLLIKLLYDLCCQDLPPMFDDQLQSITGVLVKYLMYQNNLLVTNDEAESGPLEYLKVGIFEVLVLFMQKYEADFGKFLKTFDIVTVSWHLLTNLGPETKYDMLISRALQFLTSIARHKSHAEVFNNDGIIQQVVDGVILPNVTLRESDLELFEDEPIEFIRRDLEGSDSDTRRRAATDFLRQLMEQFEVLVTGVVTREIEKHLAHYDANRSANWKSKDTASYLFTSIAAKGTVTAADGVKTINPNVDVIGFFAAHIAENMTSDNAQPLLTVNAIKFVYIFRSQISRENWQQAFPRLINNLASSNYVVYTYAAIAVERVLHLTTEDKQPVIARADITPLAADLLRHLFKLIQRDSVAEKLQENEFLMRCVMRVLIVVKDGVLPICEEVVTNFVNITNVMRHNPSNPRFYYYHFEAIGALIRFAAPAKLDSLESALFEPFVVILKVDGHEFSPYVIQLFAALVESDPGRPLPEVYKGLIAEVLRPDLWESKGNALALTRLLTAIIPRAANEIMQNNYLEPLLGIFQNLIAKKATETQAFDLIESILATFPAESLANYFVEIIRLILARLSSNKTETLTQRFIRFFHFVSSRDDKGLGTDFFIEVTDKVQNDVFKPIYLSIILPDTQKLSRPYDRKTAVVSFVKIMTDSTAFVNRYPKGWSLTCEALLKLLINPPLPQGNDDIIQDRDAEDVGFGVGFTQLSTCRRPTSDPFPEIQDVKQWAGAALNDADTRHNGRISKLVQERLSEDARATLVAYMSGK